MEHISEFDRAAYQRAARTVLRHPLITETFPDPQALPLVRRWAAPLAADLLELFGYRLELTTTTARLIRVLDELDATRPARTRSDRVFDRRRYAYLALALAVLDRAGTQVALSELADRVAGEAARIDGLELSAERAADRAAFVDAVGWLEDRGALRRADGSARSWAENPDAGEALYDIGRDAVRAVYRPSRVLQHVQGVQELLSRSQAVSRDTIRREAAQRVRRALVEGPVVYFDALDPGLRGMARSPGTADDVSWLTGAPVERRSDGVALLDVSNSLSDRRFPGTGTISQVALLLINAIADRVEDTDAPPLATFPAPEPESVTLAVALDAALPRSGVLRIDGEDSVAGDEADGNGLDEIGSGDGDAVADTPRRYPLLERGWLELTVRELVAAYGSTFAAAWVADPDGLLDEALMLLADLRMVTPTAGGVLALPLLARYRNAEVRIGRRTIDEAGLFAV